MSNEIWISALTYGGGIITALGVGKIIPAIIERWKELRVSKDNRYKKVLESYQKLEGRLETVEEELAREKSINARMQATLNSMLPLMKIMMHDVPAHVDLLEQLERNVFGDFTPTDGNPEKNR